MFAAFAANMQYHSYKFLPQQGIIVPGINMMLGEGRAGVELLMGEKQKQTNFWYWFDLVQLGLNHQVVLLLRSMKNKMNSTRNINAQLQAALAAKYI